MRQDPAFAGIGEGGEEFGRIAGPVLGGCFGEGFFAASAVLEEEAVEFLEFVALLSGESGAAQADHIESGQGIVPGGHAIGRDVPGDGGIARHHGEVADPDELMERGGATNEGLIADHNMSGEEGVVGEDVTMAEAHIVGEMSTSHEEVVVPKSGVAARFRGAIDGDVFAERVSRA